MCVCLKASMWFAVLWAELNLSGCCFDAFDDDVFFILFYFFAQVLRLMVSQLELHHHRG